MPVSPSSNVPYVPNAMRAAAAMTVASEARIFLRVVRTHGILPVAVTPGSALTELPPDQAMPLTRSGTVRCQRVTDQLFWRAR